MYFAPKTITLKDGRTAILRSPLPEQDAADMLQYLVDVAAETPFLFLAYPEERESLTVEQEQAFLRGFLDDPIRLMMVAEVDGRIAGNCQINFKTAIKTRHRCTVSIGLRQAYWNLGIGTAMFQEMIDAARRREGVVQMELEVMEGNNRARALYEKMGFRIAAVHPNRVRLKDDTFLNEYLMIKEL